LPQNISRTSSPLNKKSHSSTETFLLKNTSRQPTGLNRSDRFGKPVRPVLWDLASQQAGETGQAGFVRKLPKTPPRPKLPQNISRTSPPLNKESHSSTETFLLKNTSRQPTGLNRSDRFGKPVRPVLLGQSERTQPTGKTQLSKRSISRFIP
jgi:hypothetical protein